MLALLILLSIWLLLAGAVAAQLMKHLRVVAGALEVY
jgi:hypothetical protein